ncbi:DUF4349 domain-containing protein [Streptomyces sp. NPDC002889]|uniref:DUF4349 domain-containing protein n=1 Tax=Streptomyces sp. NPDC002889 TaxID=3364669 RepID=UPI0036C8F31B
MRAPRALAALLLLTSLTLAGCAGSDSSTDAQNAGGAAERAPGDAKGGAGYGGDEAAAGKPADSGAGRGGTPQQPSLAPAHIIRTAELDVEVKDAPKALAAARRTAERAGGRVENETTERLDDTHVSSRVVLRVPQEHYDSVLAELAGAGKLQSRKADAKDVTDQVVDVESRIATQRASVTRVRELMERATKLSDVVTLEGQLSSRQAALESLLAQQAALKDRTTLATITLSLSETEREESGKQDDDPGFLDALAGGWGALVATLRWITVAIGAVAPFAAVGALLYALWRWLVRRRLPKRPVAAAVSVPAAAPAPGTDQD